MWNAFRNRVGDRNRAIITSTGQPLEGVHPAYFPFVEAARGLFDSKQASSVAYWAPFGNAATSDLSPEYAPRRTFANF